MKTRLRRAVSAFLVLGLVFSGPFAAAKLQTPSTTAQSYAIVDASDGSILSGKMPHKRLPPASTAKVMTVLVVMKFLPLDYPVSVRRKAAASPSSKADLTRGATYKATDLVKACLVASS